MPDSHARCVRRVQVLLLAACLMLFSSVAPTRAWGYYSLPAPTISLASSVSLNSGETQQVSCAVEPLSERQLPGCGMAECPQACDGLETPSGVVGGCMDAAGWCTCAGTMYSTVATSVSVSSSNPAVALGTWNGGVLVVSGYRPGSATLTVSATLSKHLNGQAQISVEVAAVEQPQEPQPAESDASPSVPASEPEQQQPASSSAAAPAPSSGDAVSEPKNETAAEQKQEPAAAPSDPVDAGASGEAANVPAAGDADSGAEADSADAGRAGTSKGEPSSPADSADGDRQKASSASRATKEASSPSAGRFPVASDTGEESPQAQAAEEPSAPPAEEDAAGVVTATAVGASATPVISVTGDEPAEEEGGSGDAKDEETPAEEEGAPSKAQASRALKSPEAEEVDATQVDVHPHDGTPYLVAAAVTCVAVAAACGAAALRRRRRAKLEEEEGE